MDQENRSPELFWNQIVWALDTVGKRKSYWPAVVLDDKQWSEVPKNLKPILSDEKLIWWLRTNSAKAMSKVSVWNLFDFIQYFDIMFQGRSVKLSYKNAVLDAAKIACLSVNRNACVTWKNVLSMMSEMAKNKFVVIAHKKSQWKIILPKNLHETLVEPYYVDSDGENGSKNIEVEIAAESLQNEEVISLRSDEEIQENANEDFPLQYEEIIPLRNDEEMEENVKEKTVVDEVEVTEVVKIDNVSTAHSENDRNIENSTVSNICPKGAELTVRLDRKRKFVHKFKKNSYVCFVCHMKSFDYNEMLKHISVHFPVDESSSNKESDSAIKTPFCCPYCSFESSNQFVVINHLGVHLNPK